MTDIRNIRVLPLTRERWNDLEALFGERGACAGCWCMWWRLPRSQWTLGKGKGNRKAFKQLVDSGDSPGLLAYIDGRPVAWCAVAPRQSYPVLARSRTLKPFDEKPVWSVTCFFVPRDFRGQGLSVHLLEAAKRFVREQGGQVIEGYPVAPKRGRMPDAFAWTGLVSAFKKAGFREVSLRGSRSIMRYHVSCKFK